MLRYSIEKTTVVIPSKELVASARSNDSEAIRELIAMLHYNGNTLLKKTKEDHRFHQGYLQALEDLYGLVTKK